MDRRPPKRKAAVAAEAASASVVRPRPKKHKRKTTDEHDEDSQQGREDEMADERQEESENEEAMEEDSSSSSGWSDWEDRRAARSGKGRRGAGKDRNHKDGTRTGVAANLEAAAPAADSDEGEEDAEGDEVEGAVDEQADVEMQDVADVCPDTVLSTLDTMGEKLQTLMQRLQQTKQRAKHVYEMRENLPPPDTDLQQQRTQELDRHYRVMGSMVLQDAHRQIDNAESAMEQLEQANKKFDILEGKMHKLNDEGGYCACLEGLPEALWLSDDHRIGIGGHLGFPSSIESLSCVSTYFHHLTTNSSMHPIAHISMPPREKVAKTWHGRLLECRELKVDHRPTVALVRLLEAVAPSFRRVDLRGYANGHQEGGRILRGRHHMKMPHNRFPVEYPLLATAVVRGGWSNMAADRNMQLPALTALDVVDLTASGPRSFISRARNGLRSLHIPFERELGCRSDVNLIDIVDSLMFTASAKTLRSLTGRGRFQGVNLDAFINLFRSPTGSGRLQKIEMCLAELGDDDVRSVSFIKALDRFRATCLAPGATEVYWGALDIQRPVDLAKKGLSAASVTVLPWANTLQPHQQQLSSLVCGSATKLTIAGAVNAPWNYLPSYITANPAALFPNVETVVAEQGDGQMFFYLGGADTVLGKLPSLSSVTFNLRALAAPTTSLFLVPEPVSLLSVKGSPLRVVVGWRVDLAAGQGEKRVEWRMYGVGDRGRQVMERRVRTLQIELTTLRYGRTVQGLSAAEARTMCRTLAQRVGMALDSFPLLQRVVLVLRVRPRFSFPRILRDMAQGKFAVSVVDGVTLEMTRPATKSGDGEGGGRGGGGKKEKKEKASQAA
ncbi:unnamed protein product [Vitrella brassicaformis CCMP3155]|uniref:Uncharacterized protein n=3 Tax=Vitrella brassicaformis TaxID=1169539 RepID=A0A0G4FV39_VITBC|nr:unnamed protein product [Vitrella brassicaformis CCMP3155]|eukprot:CEM18528.1 unnamed protein product [Vitrella brassicaformis CCMP3155]